MIVIIDPEVIKEVTRSRYVCACIGNFDGVHLGHQELIKEAKSASRSKDGISLAVTFNQNTKIINGENKFLTILPEKTSIISSFGIDYAYLIDFPGSICQLSAKSFIEKILIDTLNVKEIFIGANFRFGHNRSGDYQTLIDYGKMYDFQVRNHELIYINELIISSSITRNVIKEGKVDIAKQLLGYSYFLSGIVGMGKRRGKAILVPTANVYNIDSFKLIPGNGVYTTLTIIDSKIYKSLTIIGLQPTFNDDDFAVENHILDFNGNIYGKTISIIFINKLRDIKKFDNIPDLKLQIDNDINSAREYFILNKGEIESININWFKF